MKVAWECHLLRRQCEGWHCDPGMQEMRHTRNIHEINVRRAASSPSEKYIILRTNLEGRQKRSVRNDAPAGCSKTKKGKKLRRSRGARLTSCDPGQALTFLDATPKMTRRVRTSSYVISTPPPRTRRAGGMVGRFMVCRNLPPQRRNSNPGLRPRVYNY